ncbi:MAG TPA: PilZ domain-containing protein [Gaiellaceae bacterium]|nr:PilZ domain-containing protein [Gaiellaceae bacterium]
MTTLGALDFLWKPVSLDYLAEVLTYIELHARPRPHQPLGRAPTLPARQSRRPRPDYNGAELHGMSVELGISGMRVRSSIALSRDAAVILSFTLPDRQTPISILSLVARVDGDQYGLTFVNLLEGDFRHLSDFVRGAVAA